jgi:hypothetical protein
MNDWISILSLGICGRFGTNQTMLDLIKYSLRCSKGSRLGHDCAYQGVINYYGVFSVCPY